MTPAGEILRDEIGRDGPISFRRFTEAALYDAEHGYYRRARDPFGREGDYYTAEQVQPVFGILMAARVRALFREMGEPAAFTVVELGAGRREMEEAFSEWRYVPVDIDSGELPARMTGVVFSNEFFDALPVDVAVWSDGGLRELAVDWADGRFVWVTGGATDERAADYVRRYFPAPEEGRIYEINLDALAWIGRITRSLTAGYAITIDYGFTRTESVRFPRGTLMSYRRHTASEDVLRDPGTQDITAHVNFTALQEHGEGAGLAPVRLETLAQMLLGAGEADQFGAALAASTPAEELRRRLQLKTLLFGMGETFRVLLQKRRRPEEQNEKGPDPFGAS